ncbi:AraC family transcriptional regulator [Actinoplanes sp. NPDC051346]|uniref:AraC family transcriptional regulator n=1 Tax=Actinoplanes sp. NPDC051346 TaxID=3155048 RepID=UPI00343BB12E
MDALTGLLDQPRARGAFLLRSILNPPWCLRIEDRAPISLVTMVRGSAWILPDGDHPLRLHPGDVAIARGPEPYTIADAPDTPVQIVIHPGQGCTTVRGEDMAQDMSLGVRTWGDSADGAAIMLSGTYQLHSEVSQRLLRALPPLLVRPAGAAEAPLVALLGAEIAKNELGQEIVLDRLLDLLLVTVLRSWLAEADTTPGWYRAQQDPVVGPALRLMHADPAYPWTVVTLAGKVGASRAAFARRFTTLVGESPMKYLTDWRLDLAADLLREPDATVAAVARQVGYGSAFALSAAFKRVRGLSPQEHRRPS